MLFPCLINVPHLAFRFTDDDSSSSRNLYGLVTVYVNKIYHRLCHSLCHCLKYVSGIVMYGIVEINPIHKMISFLVIILVLTIMKTKKDLRIIVYSLEYVNMA